MGSEMCIRDRIGGKRFVNLDIGNCSWPFFLHNEDDRTCARRKGRKAVCRWEPSHAWLDPSLFNKRYFNLRHFWATRFSVHMGCF